MSTDINITSEWSTDLNSRSAPRVSYAYLGKDEGIWIDAGEGLEARDLGAAEATDDRVGARDIRATFATTTQWRAHEGDFLAVCVRSGSAEIELDDSTTLTLAEGDTAYVPKHSRHRLALAAGATVIEITSPATAVFSNGPVLDDLPAGHGEPIVSREAPDNYSSDGGPLSRSFFSYRDVGVSDATGRRIMLEVLKAVEPADRTGWHTHSMGQIALILTGKAMIQVEEYDPVVLEAGATAYIGCRMRHDVYDVDPDYSLLEVYMPADWDTIPCPPPPAAPPRSAG
jgi:quercetin dioxygenase-like cupin family protein